MGDPSPATGCSLKHCPCCHSAIIRPRILILNPDRELEGQQGQAWQAEGWELLEGPFGFGPTLPALPRLQRVQAATSTLGSEVCTEHSLPLWLPPLGKLTVFPQPQHFFSRLREARPAWKL